MKKILVSALLVGGAFVTSAANAAVIDNFDYTNQDTGVVPASGSNSVGPLALNTPLESTVAGFRTLSVPASQPIVGNSAQLVANDPAPAIVQQLSFSLNTGATGSGLVTWTGGALASGGGADLGDGGSSTYFSFDITQTDQNNISLVVSVADTSLNSGSYTLTGQGTGTKQIPFNVPQFSGIDFAHIGAISLEVIGVNAADFALDQFFTSGQLVPEPATVALMGIGLFGVGAASARKRKLG